MSKDVLVVVGAGQIGRAIARRVGVGRQILLASLNLDEAEQAVSLFRNAGYQATAATVDVGARDSVQALVAQASRMGSVSGLIHAAGVSPSQAPLETILRVDLYGTALVLELFGNVMAAGGSAVVIASQSGHRLPALTQQQDSALAMTPTEQLLQLDFLQAGQVADTLHAYQLSKRGNALRVMAEAVRWGQRGARVNTISPGIIITPLANAELNGPRGAGYRNMLSASPVGRAGTPDEVAQLAALLMGPDGTFITGSDFLMDGGVTAAFRFGDIQQPALSPVP
ncbi:SDR family oxidoreductase [Aquitalea sp.]|uniref:SDR family oxidoreductase n=1 Tax=Aquitalea sp. TaxID=1872623 RepID=UPI0025884974|nr:SDR family oxidoreductase [Aquitalea sp.]